MNPTGSFVRNQKKLKIKIRIKKSFSCRGRFYKDKTFFQSIYIDNEKYSRKYL